MNFSRVLSLLTVLGFMNINLLAYDVVIYGGTPAAITAALQVKKMGKSVVLVSPDRTLGGVMTNGLSSAETGMNELIGGIARDFYHRIWRHYQAPDSWKWQNLDEFGNRGQGTSSADGDRRTMWVYEPSVAQQIFDSWIAENEIEVFLDEQLDRIDGVEILDGEIISIRCLSGKRFEGQIFLDCTYEGDLMAAAGVTYVVGREGNARHGETLNGVQVANAKSNQFVNRIDPFWIPGDSSSSLLPGVTKWIPAEDGEGDHKIPAYHFSLCLTKVEGNKEKFPKPDFYEPKNYELLLRIINRGSRHILNNFDPIPNAKVNPRIHGPFSLNNIGMNYLYPEGSYEERALITKQHEDYAKGYYYFLSNDPRVPTAVRDELNQWGLARDEFVGNENWPSQLNVSGARRMVGERVLTERHLFRLRKIEKPIGIGSDIISTNNVQRYFATGENGNFFVLNEGAIQVEAPNFSQISLDFILPKKEECKNLIVPVCLSASHVAYNAIGKEPILMVLGQSAGTAAVLAIEANSSIHDLAFEDLRNQLLKDDQILEVKRSNRITQGIGIEAGGSGVITVDDTNVELEGEWEMSASLRPFVGDSYFHDGNGGKGLKAAKFPFVAPMDGLHEIQVAFSAFGNRAGNVKYTVKHEDGLDKILVDQRKPPPIHDIWLSLGSFRFKKNEQYSVSLNNENTEGYVIVDAIQVISLNTTTTER
jgi:hypothetical protein